MNNKTASKWSAKCHPEPFASLEGRLREGYRFFVGLRPPQNDNQAITHLKYMVLIFLLIPVAIFGFSRMDDQTDSVIRGGFWSEANIPIQVYIDSDGGLLYTTNDAETLTNQVFNTAWNAIDTSFLTLEVAGTMTRAEKTASDNDVTFVYLVSDENEIPEELSGIFGGGGLSTILGLAMSFSNTGSATGEYTSSLIAINGLHTSMTDTQYKTTVTHELGHFLGLDHSTIYSSDDTQLPTMFSISVNEQEQLSLSSDDKIGLSAIYPNEVFTGDKGAIKGNVTDVHGNPIFGAQVSVYSKNDTNNVIAVAITGNPLCFTTSYRVEGLGEYIIPGLDPGQYIVKIESFPFYGGDAGSERFLIIDEGAIPQDTGSCDPLENNCWASENASGSGVGIYDFGLFDIGFPTEYYNNKISTDELTDEDYVTIAAGSVTENVDFVTGFDETLSGSVSISVMHPRRGDLKYQISIGSEDGPPTTGEITISDNTDNANLYIELTFDELETMGIANPQNYLPPDSSTNKWYLKVRDSERNNTSSEISEALILAFKINYNETIYYATSGTENGSSATLPLTLFDKPAVGNKYSIALITSNDTLTSLDSNSDLTIDTICYGDDLSARDQGTDSGTEGEGDATDDTTDAGGDTDSRDHGNLTQDGCNCMFTSNGKNGIESALIIFLISSLVFIYFRRRTTSRNKN